MDDKQFDQRTKRIINTYRTYAAIVGILTCATWGVGYCEINNFYQRMNQIGVSETVVDQQEPTYESIDRMLEKTRNLQQRIGEKTK